VSSPFGRELLRLRSERGLSLAQLARLVPCHRGYLTQLEHGTRNASPTFAARLDATLGAGGLLGGLAAQQNDTRSARSLPPGNRLIIVDPAAAEPGRPLTAADADTLRATIGHLVALDNAYGADDIANLAVRAYRNTDAALANDRYDPRAERDLQAIAGELAEVSGWLLYDADRQDDARRLARPSVQRYRP